MNSYTISTTNWTTANEDEITLFKKVTRDDQGKEVSFEWVDATGKMWVWLTDIEDNISYNCSICNRRIE
jgi:hypothetical protein